MSLDSMIGADIAAAVVLISMGALLGRTTPIQLMFIGLIEIAVFAANEYLQLEIIKVFEIHILIFCNKIKEHYTMVIFLLKHLPLSRLVVNKFFIKKKKHLF